MNEFFNDVWRGLNTSPKYLAAKYFYDATGDAIFNEIMDMPEYYLTNCELDIFTKHKSEIANTILSYFRDFDVVELGAGDATKSAHLLDVLLRHEIDFTYYPIDISQNIITQLNKKLPERLPGLKIHGLNGEYFEMLDELKDISTRNKVVLFLGANIGNVPLEDTPDFFTKLRSHLLPGDLVLTGFDLKKDPAIILNAYNDRTGITRRFNLNLLQRINDTLDADFDISQFEHNPTYDDESGACKSYLTSRKDQRVRVGEVGWIYFKEGEQIYMEVSQKYTTAQIDAFAEGAGFKTVRHFYDSKRWFIDALWQCV